MVVQDQYQPCPYLAGQTARMPLNLPIGSVTPDVIDALLERGYRRSGDFLYQTRCPACQACQPTRVVVNKFNWSKSMRRVLSRGDRELVCQWGRPGVDAERIQLFNAHRRERGLDHRDREIESDSYRSFLVDTCCETRELAISRGGRLIAIAIVDFAETSLSAVYTQFDPTASRFSPGTYAIIKQIELAALQRKQFVYLGMYVAANSHLNYKSRFTPQERLIAGNWVAIEP